MLTTVKRPNHYELLRLSPSATSQEVADAFAREVSSFRPRPFGAAAEVCAAYATLRDPAKRRAYDASIGLHAAAVAAPASPTSVELHYRREWRPAAFVAAPSKGRGPDNPELRAELSPPFHAPRAASPATTPSIKDQVEALLARRGLDAESKAPLLHGEWSRPGLTVAALLLAAAAIGGFAGLKSVETIEPEEAAQAATVRVPPAKATPEKALTNPANRTAEMAVAPETAAATTARPRMVKPKPTADALTAVAVESITESIQVTKAPSREVAGEQSAIDPAASAAALPLSNKAVARTIERIGYPCGAVDSALPVEGGGAGVFKVSCTSGDTYRAAPVNGRYRFRRWAQR